MQFFFIQSGIFSINFLSILIYLCTSFTKIHIRISMRIFLPLSKEEFWTTSKTFQINYCVKKYENDEIKWRIWIYSTKFSSSLSMCSAFTRMQCTYTNVFSNPWNMFSCCFRKTPLEFVANYFLWYQSTTNGDHKEGILATKTGKSLKVPVEFNIKLAKVHFINKKSHTKIAMKPVFWN